MPNGRRVVRYHRLKLDYFRFQLFGLFFYARKFSDFLIELGDFRNISGDAILQLGYAFRIFRVFIHELVD